jgi:putative addiction module component (TIGR02574 family)
MNIQPLCNEALSLPVHERAQLAEQLLASLENLSEAETEQVWSKEAARRAAEMDQGLVQRILADEVRQEALALLK